MKKFHIFDTSTNMYFKGRYNGITPNKHEAYQYTEEIANAIIEEEKESADYCGYAFNLIMIEVDEDVTTD